MQSGITTGTVTAITLVTSVAIARILGPEGRGVFTAATVWPAIFAGVFCFSLNDAVTISLARPGQDDSAQSAIKDTSLVLHLVAGGVSAAVCALLVPWMLNGARADAVPAAITYGAIFSVLTMILMHQRGTLQGLGRTREINQLRLAQPALWLVAIGVVAATTAASWETVAYASVAGMLVTCAVGAWMVGFRVERFSIHEAAGLLKTGARFQVANLFLYASAEADKVLAISLLGNRDVGIYVVAQSVAGLVHGLVSQTLGVRLLGEIAAADPTEQPERIRRFLHGSSLAAFVLCTGAVVCAPLLPILYGREFQSAVVVSQILAVGFMFKAARTPLDWGLRAMKQFVPGVVAEVAALILMVGMAIGLEPSLGLLGLCIAFVTAQLAALICISTLASARLQLSLKRLWGIENGHHGEFVSDLWKLVRRQRS